MITVVQAKMVVKGDWVYVKSGGMGLHPVDQLSDQDLCSILQRLDRTGMRVPLSAALKEIPRYRNTLKALPPDPAGHLKVLDLGAGRQWLPFYEIILGYRNISVNTKYSDSSEWAGSLNVSGVDDAEVEVSVFDVELDPFPHEDNEFDVVCCFELLEHLAIDPMHMMLEIQRVLKPGGILVLTTPNVVRTANVVSMLLGEHPYGWSPYNGFDTNRHNREYTPHEIGLLMESAGMSVDRLMTVGRKKRGMKRDLLARMVSMILAPVRGCPLSMRRDLILCVAKNVGAPTDRRPNWLYYDMSDRVISASEKDSRDSLASGSQKSRNQSDIVL